MLALVLSDENFCEVVMSCTVCFVYKICCKGSTRWTTTLSAKVNLPHGINFRALCGANLVTSSLKFGSNETLVVHRVDEWMPYAVLLLTAGSVGGPATFRGGAVTFEGGWSD